VLVAFHCQIKNRLFLAQVTSTSIEGAEEPN